MRVDELDNHSKVLWFTKQWSITVEGMHLFSQELYFTQIATQESTSNLSTSQQWRSLSSSSTTSEPNNMEKFHEKDGMETDPMMTESTSVEYQQSADTCVCVISRVQPRNCLPLLRLTPLMLPNLENNGSGGLQRNPLSSPCGSHMMSLSP
jgi:hypothetical protein